MKRVSRACQQCRSKHIKCNGRSPCSRCIAHAELHNISPSEICLYPEPKKRGRPSAGASTHHAHHHNNSYTSSSVAKKRLNNITNKGRVTSSIRSAADTIITTRSTVNNSKITSPDPTATASPLSSHLVQLQLPRWQKASVINSDPIIYWNGTETIQMPYVFSQQIPINHTQIPVTIADLFARNPNLNLMSNYPDYAYLNTQQQQQQPQPRVFTLNPVTSPSLTNTVTVNSTTQNKTTTGNSGNYYHHSYGNSSNGGRSHSITTAPQNFIISTSSNCNTLNRENNNNNNNNNNNCSPHSHHYHLNRPYHARYSYSYSTNAAQVNANNNGFVNDNIFVNTNNNFSSESSDSSNSPESSLTSTPEQLPILNTNAPSLSNSPLLPPSEYNPYLYGVNSNPGNLLNMGHVDHLLHDFMLPSYQQESELDLPLLYDAKSEIAYVSSVAPYSITSNSIYPSSLERTTTYVKTEDRLPYDPLSINTAGWPY